jgi:cell division protein FtsA
MFKSKKRSQDETRHFVVGLDIGTSKIAAIIGEQRGESSTGPDSKNPVLIIGSGVTPCKGFRRGVVINFEEAVKSIQLAVQEAQLTAGVKIDEAYVGIAGEHLHSVNSRGVVAVSHAGQEVTLEDKERVMHAAKAIVLPGDRKVIHTLPQEFIVDNQTGIKNPVGLSGVRLEAEVHIVTCTAAMAQNLLRAVEEAGLHCRALVLESLASSFSVLESDEMKLGTVLIDIGGGITDIAMFYGDAIRHTAVVPLGGQNVTNDIAIGIKTSIDEAEQIKKQYGFTNERCIDPYDTFSTVPLGGRESKEVDLKMLSSIIRPRMEEIYSLVLKEIKRSEYANNMDAGVVLTGGGSLLKGAVELAEEVFRLPVRLGVPKDFSGLTESVSSPVFATGIGLVLFGQKAETSELLTDGEGGFKDKGWFQSTWERFRKEFF